MQHKLTFTSLLSFLLIAGCVTINVYFPAVAAEKEADKIIEDVWGATSSPSGKNETAPPQSQLSHSYAQQLGLAMLDFVLPAAQAAEPSPDINISSPAIRSIVNAMEARHSELKPYYDSGVLGLTREATITIRNIGPVSLAKRNMLKQLVAEENADRNTLYREIAVVNGHPEWEAQIRATFAERWISKAQSGWYYEEGDVWAQKK